MSSYEGDLYKLSHTTRIYQPRYFVINSSTSTLHYYSSKHLSHNLPMRSLKLANCTIFANETCPKSFSVHEFDYKNVDCLKSWYFIADSGDERLAWINAMKKERNPAIPMRRRIVTFHRHVQSRTRKDKSDGRC